MSKLVKRFKSQVSWQVSVSVFQGEKGMFATIQKSRKNKEKNEWEDIPFMNPADLAAVVSSAQQAIAFIDQNHQPPEKSQAVQIEEALPKSLAEEEIPF